MCVLWISPVHELILEEIRMLLYPNMQVFSGFQTFCSDGSAFFVFTNCLIYFALLFFFMSSVRNITLLAKPIGQLGVIVLAAVACIGDNRVKVS